MQHQGTEAGMLTPEDIMQKRFRAVRFREGYDSDDVDGFLDQVAVSLRTATELNDQLGIRMVQLEEELRRHGIPVPPQ